MIFGRKHKQQMKIDPAFGLARLRSAIELAVADAASCGVRSYQIEQTLDDARTAVRVKHAASSPL
jgi:hypothetical protein